MADKARGETISLYIKNKNVWKGMTLKYDALFFNDDNLENECQRWQAQSMTSQLQRQCLCPWGALESMQDADPGQVTLHVIKAKVGERAKFKLKEKTLYKQVTTKTA